MAKILKILKNIYHFLFDKSNVNCIDCVNCVYGTSTGEWCWDNCKGGNQFIDINSLPENENGYYEIENH